MKMNGDLKLIECPRDAMQGWKQMIPVAKKAEYINSLLKVGFDTIDFGSFVSAKAIPQLADTAQLIPLLQKDSGASKLLAIVANIRGASEAVVFDQIDQLGFPFSVSPTFQQRNTNSSIEESFERVEEIQNLCIKNKKELIVYLSMGFGNPYGDDYDEEIVFEWADQLAGLDINIISVADTVGLASPLQVSRVTGYLVDQLPGIEIGVHLHSRVSGWKEKVDAALDAGCLRFDGALKGIGGCPMADDDLVGNMDSELMIPHFERMGYLRSINHQALEQSSRIAAEIFS